MKRTRTATRIRLSTLPTRRVTSRRGANKARRVRAGDVVADGGADAEGVEDQTIAGRVAAVRHQAVHSREAVNLDANSSIEPVLPNDSDRLRERRSTPRP